jgi:hypothetical protein
MKNNRRQINKIKLHKRRELSQLRKKENRLIEEYNHRACHNYDMLPEFFSLLDKNNEHIRKLKKKPRQIADKIVKEHVIKSVMNL